MNVQSDAKISSVVGEIIKLLKICYETTWFSIDVRVTDTDRPQVS